MKWLLVIVLMNPWQGGIRTEKVEFENSVDCEVAKTVVERNVTLANGWKIPVLVSAFCLGNAHS